MLSKSRNICREWQDISFSETSTHIDVTTTGVHNFISTIFVKCKADKGGSIYSKQKATHYVLWCVFLNSSAIGTDSVGAAIAINAGSLIFTNLCVDNSFCYHGSDLWCGGCDNVKFQNIQTSHCVAEHAGCAIGTATNVEVNNMNISMNDINGEGMTFFGSAITFDNFPNHLIIKFINAFQCYGRKSVVGFGYFNRKNMNVEYINILKNENLNSFFCLREGHDSNLYVSNSNFVNNKGNDYCSIETTSTNIQTTFTNCQFSFMREQQSNNINIQSCKFNIQNALIHIDNHCFNTKIKYCVSPSHIINRIFLIVNLFTLIH